MAELKIGTKVKDRYTLTEFKGSGSFGEVWLAHDDVLDCDIAIKIYISLDPRGIEEFKSEYITTQGISHPNLLTTTYFDVWEQRPYLVMKYCANGSSSKRASQMDEYALWQFIHDVAAGLGHLHNLPEPIIHQDIKPDNILVDDNDHYLITDFGISKKIRSTMRKQSKRAVGAGATAYMGPERFDSDPTPIKASDIWSLGASIYELATGELPFSGLGGGMQKNGAEMPSLDKKWSKDMNMVMQSCLSKETWNRPTAQQLEQYADAILKGTPANVTWTVQNLEEKDIQTDSNQKADTSTEEPISSGENNSNKKVILGVLFLIVIALLVIFWPSNKSEYDVAPVKTETIDSSATSVKKEKVDIPEVTQKSEKNNSSTESGTVKVEQPQDNNATILKKALSNGDYQKVQKLANQGYAPAYVPLAKYYLQNNEYTSADNYAKKAKTAGQPGAQQIITQLDNLGYYD